MRIAAGGILLAASTLQAGEEDWKILTTQAQNHLQRGNLEQALLFARQALKESEAEAMHRRALSIFEKTYGANDRRTAAALHGLGSALLAQGKLTPAVTYLRRALAAKEKIFGPSSLTTGHTLKNLALALQHLDRKEEAAKMRERAAMIFK